MDSACSGEPIPLRPHHLLCLLTYGGAGYTPEFVANLDSIVERVNSGESTIQLVEGPDAICGPMMQCREHPDFHCENASVRQRDVDALREVSAALRQTGNPSLPSGLAFGTVLTMTAEWVGWLRGRFADGNVRTACLGCEWRDHCTARARGAFAGAKLHPGTAAQTGPRADNPGVSG